MKPTIVIIAAVLAGVMCAEGAAAAPQRHVRIPSCLARQRAMLTPLDRYGGYVPPNAPALMQQLINPMLDAVRTRCFPVYHDRPVFNPVTGNYE